MERMKSGRLLAAFVVALVATVALVLGASARAYAEREEVTWDSDQAFDSSADIMAYVYVDKDITVTVAEGKTVTVLFGINTHSHTPNQHTITVAGKGTLIVYGVDGEIGEYQEGIDGEAGKAAVFGNLIVDGATVQCFGGAGGAGEDGETPGSGGDGAVGLTGNLTVKGGTARMAGGDGGAVGLAVDDDAEGPAAGKPAKAVQGEISANVIQAGDDGKTYKAIEGPTTDAQYVIATSEVEPEPGPEPGPEPAEGQEMFRLYNPYSGEHFYTASELEHDVLVGLGWQDEGVGWVAPTEGAPVFRLYNPYGGDHHYTMSAFERDELVKVGWLDEGVGWRSAGEDGTPVLRQYNPYASAGAHNFTTSAFEAESLVGLGWKDEGIGWYAL